MYQSQVICSSRAGPSKSYISDASFLELKQGQLTENPVLRELLRYSSMLRIASGYFARRSSRWSRVPSLEPNFSNNVATASFKAFN